MKNAKWLGLPPEAAPARVRRWLHLFRDGEEVPVCRAATERSWGWSEKFNTLRGGTGKCFWCLDAESTEGKEKK